MAVTAHVYSKFHLSALLKTIDFTNDSIKIMLVTSTYTPNQSTEQFLTSNAQLLTNQVANGNGYTTTGAALGTKSAASSALVATFDAADAVWSASSIVARFAVVYDSTPGTDATRPLICYIDFGADVTSSGGNFTIQFDAAGIWTMTVA